MPSLSYLALDDVSRLTRGDLVRLALVMRPGDSQTLPCSERFLQDFEYRYCYDRHWEDRHAHSGANTRFMCNGQAFTVIGRRPIITSSIPRMACSASFGISISCCV